MTLIERIEVMAQGIVIGVGIGTVFLVALVALCALLGCVGP